MHTLLMDTEATFLGFSNVCASAGEDGCKIIHLLHKDATGKEIKRFIEDSRDVGDRPGFSPSSSYLLFGSQLALKVWLTKPDKAVIDPLLMTGGSTSLLAETLTGYL